MNAIVTVVGKDRVGIIAEVSRIMADRNINIQDISQTIMNSFFTMMMLVSLDKSLVDIDAVRNELKQCGEKLGLSITLQHQDVFEAMHRV